MDREYEEAFQKLKEYLVNSPLVAKPKPGEVLLLYLTVSEHTTSSVLLKKDEDRVQRLIYYIGQWWIRKRGIPPQKS